MHKNPWYGVLRATQRELKRISQDVEGSRVLPDRIELCLPADKFSAWSPILGSVLGDFGQALLQWAERCGHRWLDSQGHIERRLCLPLALLHFE